MKKVIIVGGGPCGLFCAYNLLKDKTIKVELYDQKQRPGTKFLVAGKSGLNLTHNCTEEEFSKNYFKQEELFFEWFKKFNNKDLINWVHDLGIETFVGSSERVFPKEMKGANLLNRWLALLDGHENFTFFPKTKLIDFNSDGVFINEKWHEFDSCLFSLGGASWARTGSDGLWSKVFSQNNILVKPFYALNCGFSLEAPTNFLLEDERLPIKYIRLTHKDNLVDHSIKGDLMFTSFGLEGTPIYYLSHFIQEDFLKNNSLSFQTLTLDLLPDWDEKRLRHVFVGKKSTAEKLRKILDKDKVKLIKAVLSKEDYLNPEVLMTSIKALEIKIGSAMPIEEAISTGGGISFSEVDNNLRLNKFPKIFVGGEMLAWEAPTGGFLLQGCFTQAYIISEAIKSSISRE